jgi:hypothetical protein
MVVSHSSDYEGQEGTSWMNCINFGVAPRTQTMRAKLEALPSWPDDETCDDSLYSPGWYQTQLREKSPPWRSANEDDNIDDDEEAA